MYGTFSFPKDEAVEGHDGGGRVKRFGAEICPPNQLAKADVTKHVSGDESIYRNEEGATPNPRVRRRPSQIERAWHETLFGRPHQRGGFLTSFIYQRFHDYKGQRRWAGGVSKQEVWLFLNRYELGLTGKPWPIIDRPSIVAKARDAEYHHAPRWQRIDDERRSLRAFRIFVRLDADDHRDDFSIENSDSAGVIGFLEQLLHVQCHKAPSRRGYSGWLHIEFPVSEDHIPLYSKSVVNSLLDKFQTVLSELVTDAGFRSTIEVGGRFLLTSRVEWDDGEEHQFRREDIGGYGSNHDPITGWHPQMLVKLPPVPKNDAEMELLREQLTNAVVPWSRCEQLISGSAALAGTSPPISQPKVAVRRSDPVMKAERPLRTPEVTPKKHNVSGIRVRQGEIKITDSGSPWLNKQRVMSFVVGRYPDLDESGAVERAEQLYVANRLARGPRDKHRDMKWKDLYRWLKRSYDASRAYGTTDELWFDVLADVDAAVRLVRSRLSAAAIARKMDGCTLRTKDRTRALLEYRFVAVVLTTMAKNILTVNERTGWGECPVSAIKGMLKHMGIPYTSSAIRYARELLMESGLISRIRDYSYDRGNDDGGNHCAVYGVAEIVLKALPFLQDVEIRRTQGFVFDCKPDTQVEQWGDRTREMIGRLAERSVTCLNTPSVTYLNTPQDCIRSTNSRPGQQNSDYPPSSASKSPRGPRYPNEFEEMT